VAVLKVIFDPIYGFIHLTPVEWEIIQGPFYQRLRWIKQLGFSCYPFPGAEHSRFGHSIGVMYNAHCILQSCGIAVSDEELVLSPKRGVNAQFHQTLRLAALLHDLGTFMFSHTTEGAYIRYGETTHKKGGKGLADDHENLGSFIIKNTDYPRGVTYILKKHGIDPQEISDLVKGVHQNILANQILHAEIDCDRMDYLLRDAHYTGLKYGAYDRTYLLHHFVIKEVEGHRVLALKSNALHCVEDFLMARYAWYSQVIRSPRGAKYDAIAEQVCFYLLEKGLIHSYSDLLNMISEGPEHFYTFNDAYFMNTLHQLYVKGTFDREPAMKDMVSCVLFAKEAKNIKTEFIQQRLLNPDDFGNVDKIRKKAQHEMDEMIQMVTKSGIEDAWVLPDLPKKDIVFIKSKNSIVRQGHHANVFWERDPVKICLEDGTLRLLADIENSVISRVQNANNFTPNLFCSSSAYEFLKNKGVIE
jgi:uncharacterized protein